MRSITLRASWTDHARWSARREHYADGSHSRILQIRRLILSVSRGPARRARQMWCPSCGRVRGHFTHCPSLKAKGSAS